MSPRPLLTRAPDLAAYDWPAETLADAELGDERPPTSRVQLFKTGRFNHPRSGVANITHAVLASFMRNFHEVSAGELPFDFDHTPETRGDTRACGWIKNLDQMGKDGRTHTPDELWATVEWTWSGAWSIKEREYRYVSPSFHLNYVSDDETKRGPVLLGAALTNRAFLERMAAVTLSRDLSDDELEHLVFDAADETSDPSDSPPRMTTFANIAQTFGLTEDATEDQIITAAREAIEKAPKDGQTVVDNDELATLKAAKQENTQLHTRVESLESSSADMRFEAAFTAALTHEDGPKVAPAEKDALREVFNLSEEVFNKQIEARAPLANVTPRSERGDDATEAPEGSDAESYALDQKVQTYMGQHPELDYPTALDRVLAQEERS